jgi:hypothetical protein
MNRMYKIILALILAMPLCTSPLNAPRPGHARMQPGPMPQFGPNGMPEFSEEEFKALAQEVENFFKNMSEEELAEFVKFAEDVESGKIDINELLPPGMVQQMPPMQRPPQQPAIKPEETKPQPPEAAPAKPAPALRNKVSAQKMINDILDRLSSLRAKASSYERVADRLRPWDQQLDDLTYYLHIISDKKLVEQLISDKDLLPLHDTLKELRDSLDKQEPLLHTPAFGVEKIDPKTREQSKKALSAIIATLETSFTRKALIQGLELLMKKYEPELLKKRKEAEAAHEKALQEAEARQKLSPKPSRIRTELARSTGFYDQYYRGPVSPGNYGYQRPTPRRAAQQAPRRPQARPAAGKGPGQAPATPAQQGEAAKKEMKQEEEKKKIEEEKKKAQEGYTPTTETEKDALKYIEKISSADQIIEDAFYETVLQNTQEYFAKNLPQQPTGRTLRKARAMNTALAELSRALHRMTRDRAKAANFIKKSPEKAQGILFGQLEGTVHAQQRWLQPLYLQGLALLEKAANATERSQFANTIAVHLGYAIDGSMADMYQNERCNSLLRYLEAYEQLYKPEQQVKRKELTEMLTLDIGGVDEFELSVHCPI